MNSYQLPAANQSAVARNRLICSLVERLVSYQQIQRLNLSAVMCGASLRVGDEQDRCMVPLSGDAQRALNDWQILRPRSNPKSDALFVALSGKNTGKRLSVEAIRRIARQADAKPLNIRFGEFSENSEACEDSIQENKPKLRVIQGGR